MEKDDFRYQLSFGEDVFGGHDGAILLVPKRRMSMSGRWPFQ
jgi:hypothetical protein